MNTNSEQSIQETISKINEATTFTSISHDFACGKEIKEVLHQQGFKLFPAGSQNNKLSLYETLELNGKKVEIAQGNMLGDFTNVKVFFN